MVYSIVRGQNKIRGMNAAIERRFWAKVRKTSTCWLWTACLNKGYGRFWPMGYGVYAHRFSLGLVGRQVPQGFEVDHLCGVKNCVRPTHLEIVLKAENIRRADCGRKHREKTHCPKGHPYSGVNLVRRPSGQRQCRACGRVRALANYWKTHSPRRARRGPYASKYQRGL